LNTPTNRPAIFAAMAIVLATLGCNSTQPTQPGPLTASLKFTANATVETNDCYHIYTDTGDPNNPNDENQVWCYATGESESRFVPWHYSLLVYVIPVGQTAPTDPDRIFTSLFPGNPIPDFVSLTGYDAIVGTAPFKPEDNGIIFVPVGRVSRGNKIWLSSDLKFYDSTDPNAASGVVYNLGETNVIEQPTLDFDLNTGDTVVVEARKQIDGDPPYFTDPESAAGNPGLTITASLTVGGTVVQLTGPSSSTADSGAGFTFSYTRR